LDVRGATAGWGLDAPNWAGAGATLMTKVPSAVTFYISVVSGSRGVVRIAFNGPHRKLV
jgi:hypothetical protein